MIREDDQDVVYKTEREKFTAVIAEILELPRARAAGARRHDERREEPRRSPHPAQEEDPARGPEREAPRERGVRRRAGGPQGRDHRLHQHGRPRHRHHPRRQPGDASRTLEFQRRPVSPTPRRAGGVRRGSSQKYEASARSRATRCATLGGLHILGTERHESRRIDNQLRGRAGRQGDPGSSRFYLSLEDDLMRIFAGDRVKTLMERMGMPDDEPIEHPLVTAQHRERAAQGRGAQLRHPQEPARIRRRDERSSARRSTRCASSCSSAATRPSRRRRKEKGKTAADSPVPTESGSTTSTRWPTSCARRCAHGRRADAAAASAARDSGRARAAGDTADDPARSAIVFARRSTASHGAYPDTRTAAEDRTGTLDRLARDVASSLTQQRERLLDLFDDIGGAMVEEAADRASAGRLGLAALTRAAKRSTSVSRPRLDQFVDREELATSSGTRREGDRKREAGARRCPVSCTSPATSTSRRSTSGGSSTSRTWRPCATASASAATARRIPKQEYKKEGYDIFGEMMGIISRNVCEKLFHMQLRREESAATVEVPQPQRKRAPRRTVESGGGRRPRNHRPPAATERPARSRRVRCAATSPRSDATIPAPAAAARNTRSATERWWLRDRSGRRAGSSDVARRPGWGGPSACQSNSQASTSCVFRSRFPSPASPLTLLSNARLDRVGNGFVLIGSDRRWCAGHRSTSAARWAPRPARSCLLR